MMQYIRPFHQQIHRVVRTVVTLLACSALSVVGGWSAACPAALVASPRETGSPDTLADSGGHWDSTGWSGRVVVGEYRAGAFCGPCRLHQSVFDAVGRRYPSTVFIAVAYNGSWSLPLANPGDDLWKRLDYWYGLVFPHEVDRGAFLDGHHVVQDTSEQEMYQEMMATVATELRKPPAATVHIHVAAKGGTLATRVQVRDLAPTHAHVYVRLVVFEDTVHIIMQARANRGGTGSPALINTGVVRTVAAGGDTLPLGLPLHAVQGAGEVRYTFNLAKIQQQWLMYRRVALGLERPPADSSDPTPLLEAFHDTFADLAALSNWTINPARLYVLAFVQDAATGAVLQAQVVHVPAGLKLGGTR